MIAKPWTISKLQRWEECGLRFALEYEPHLVIDRFKGWTVAKLPPREESPAMLRGTEIHEMFDAFMKGQFDDLDLSVQYYEIFSRWRDYLIDLREAIAASDDGGGEVMWEFDDEYYEPENRATVWCRQKLDGWYVSGDVSRVWDYKTGRYYPKNKDQIEVYALGTFAKFDEVNVVDTELIYLDQEPPEGILKRTFIREKDSARLARKWSRRAEEFRADTRFDPRPGYQCRWCAYAKSKGGPCKEG